MPQVQLFAYPHSGGNGKVGAYRIDDVYFIFRGVFTYGADVFDVYLFKMAEQRDTAVGTGIAAAIYLIAFIPAKANRVNLSVARSQYQYFIHLPFPPEP